MKTLKRIAAALALSAAAVASTGSVQAGNFCYAPSSYGYAPTVCHAYAVYYRECVNSPWFVYGRFYCPDDAVQTANYLQSLGYETFIR